MTIPKEELTTKLEVEPSDTPTLPRHTGFGREVVNSIRNVAFGDRWWALAVVVLGLAFGLYLETRNTTGYTTLNLVNKWNPAANPTLPMWIALIAISAIATGALVLKRIDLFKRDLPLVLFLLLNYVSIIWAGAKARPYALHWLLYMSVAFVLYFVAAHYAKDSRNATAVVMVILVALIAFCALSLVANRMELPSNVPSQTDGRGARLTGIAEATALLGITVSILLASAVAWTVSQGIARWQRGIAALGLLVGIYVTWLSQTRTALIGIGLAGLVALWMTRHRRILVLSVVLAPFLLIGTHAVDHLVSGWRILLAGGSISDVPGLLNAIGRWSLWADVLTHLVFPWTPLIGDGVGTVVAHLGIIPHNEFLMVWIETGTVGLGLAILGYARLAGRFTRGFHSNSGGGGAVNLAALLSVIIALPSFAFTAVLDNEAGWMLMISCGLATGLSAGVRSREQEARYHEVRHQAAVWGQSKTAPSKVKTPGS